LLEEAARLTGSLKVIIGRKVIDSGTPFTQP